MNQQSAGIDWANVAKDCYRSCAKAMGVEHSPTMESEVGAHVLRRMPQNAYASQMADVVEYAVQTALKGGDLSCDPVAMFETIERPGRRDRIKFVRWMTPAEVKALPDGTGLRELPAG